MPSPAPAEERAAPLWRRLRWRWIAAAAVMSLLGTIFWRTYLVDDPPPEDADLILERRFVPPEQNGWAWFQAGNVAPRRGFVPRELETNSRVPERLEESLRFEYWDVWARDAGGEPDAADVAPVLDLKEGLVLRARWLENSGDVGAALEQWMNIIRIGRKLRASAQTGFEFLVAPLLEDEGLVGLVGLLLRTRPNGLDLGSYADELHRGAIDAASLARVVRGEYTFARDAAMKVDSWLFLPHHTLRIVGGRTRTAIGDASRPVAAWTHLSEASDATSVLGLVYRLLPDRNELGEELAHTWTRNMHGFMRCGVGIMTRTNLVRAWIAVERCRTDHGTPPQALADLVPRYLDAVPIDPWDGAPIRFNPSTRLLYSVGSDFRDSGGSSGAEWQEAFRDDTEPTLPLELPAE